MIVNEPPNKNSIRTRSISKCNLFSLWIPNPLTLLTPSFFGFSSPKGGGVESTTLEYFWIQKCYDDENWYRPSLSWMELLWRKNKLITSSKKWWRHHKISTCWKKGKKYGLQKKKSRSNVKRFLGSVFRFWKPKGCCLTYLPVFNFGVSFNC